MKIRIMTLILMICVVLAFTVPAMAASVNISGSISGSYTLGSMNIDSNGNVTLVLNSSGTTTGQLNLGISPTTLSTGAVNASYSQSVTMTASDGTPPYKYSCSGSGVSGLNAAAASSTATTGSGTCTISGTPTASGTYTVTFSATDSAASPATAQKSSSASISSGGGGGTSNCTDISSAEVPSYTEDQVIAAKSVVNYCFTLKKDVSVVLVNMFGRDWQTTSHLFVSNIRTTTYSEAQSLVIPANTTNLPQKGGTPPWYNFGIDSNERVPLSQSASNGTKYYLTVYNGGDRSSKIQLTWQAY